MFLLAKLILDNLMNQTNLEELEEELKPEILPSELRDAYYPLLTQSIYDG